MSWGVPSTGMPSVKKGGFLISLMLGIGRRINSVRAFNGLWAIKLMADGSSLIGLLRPSRCGAAEQGKGGGDHHAECLLVAVANRWALV